MRLFRILGFVFVLVLLIGAVLVYRTLTAAGYFNTVVSSFAGTCQSIAGVVGAEDIELDRQTGNLFISSQDRRPFPPTPETIKPGGIYLAAIDHPEIKPRLLTGDVPQPFHPHGISLFVDGNGKKTLAVINHARPGETDVVLFDINEARSAGGEAQVTLTVRRTVKDPSFKSPNDLTLVGHDSFYLTNDHGSDTSLGTTLETWLLLPRANVVYYDGSVARVAAEGFNYANGINRSADLATIYVAESTGRTLGIFHRDASGALLPVRSLFLGKGLDNIDVDADGNLWVATHPRMLDFLAHAQDAKKLSPSVVLKVDPTAEDGAVQTVYANTGEETSGGSVAVSNGKRMVIGTVFEPSYLNCNLSR